MEPDGMDDEAYNMINAPQFLDFSQVDADDDADADRFFDTHKEEDDYLVPVEDVSVSLAMSQLQLSDHSEIVKANGFSVSTTPGSKQLGTKISGSPTITQGTEDPGTVQHNDKSVPLVDDVMYSNASFKSALSEAVGDLSERTEALNDVHDKHDLHDLTAGEPNGTGIEEPNKIEQPEEEHHAPIVNHVKTKKLIPDHLIKPAVMPLPKKINLKMTIPQPFNLHNNRPRGQMDNGEKPEYTFKARPAPTKSSAPTGIKSKIEVKVTKAQAPHFASDDRIRERQEKKAAALILPIGSIENIKQPSGSGPSSSTNSIKAYAPPICKKQSAASTKVQPFSFAQRDKDQQRKKELNIKEKLDEKVQSYAFHATPLPSFLSSKNPKKVLVEATNVEPANLRAAERGPVRQKTKPKGTVQSSPSV